MNDGAPLSRVPSERRPTQAAGLGVPCREAQADGVPCEELGTDCSECDKGRVNTDDSHREARGA
jgi:hypothetical protein